MSIAGQIVVLICLAALTGGLFWSTLANYRFTLWILIANLAALTFPQFFKRVGGVSLTDPWILLIVIQVVMFGMGTQMRLSDFRAVLKMPIGVLVGASCHFLIMPLTGFALASLLPLPPEVAAGLVLIGSCSCGLASNVMTFMAKGNLALAITLTSVTTIIAPLVTPLWMRVLAGAMVEVDALKMALDIIKMILVPILAAFIHEFLSSGSARVRWLVRGCILMASVYLIWLTIGGGWPWLRAHAPIGWPESALALPGFVAAALLVGGIYHRLYREIPSIATWLPRLSMCGIIYYTLVATADGRDQLLSVGWILVLAVFAHNTVGYVLGYWSSRLLGLNGTDSRTIALEVGLQNGAMALGIARGMDKLNTTGLAAIVFSPVMNVTGSILANYWRKHPVDERAGHESS